LSNLESDIESEELVGSEPSLRDTIIASAQEVAAANSDEAPRVRDEAGRFASNKPIEDAVIVEPEPQPLAVRSDHIAPPSSWRKEYAARFNTIDPDIANYINQRESEYKSGVSTYRAEAERASSLNAALQPFMADLQQNNIQPEEWITNLGRAQQILVHGNSQQKAGVIAQLIQEYGITEQDFHNLQSPQSGARYDPNQQLIMQELNDLKSFRQQFEQSRLQEDEQQASSIVAQMQADTQKYPYFEQAREKMAELLRSGFTQDLNVAYNTVVRSDDNLWSATQQAERSSLQAADRQKRSAEVLRARSQVASIKSTTPSGSGAASGANSLRSIIEEQVRERSGRV